MASRSLQSYYSDIKLFLLQVLDVESRELLGPNMDGELCFKGPQVMLGYLNKPEQTKACLDEEGWFYTGEKILFIHAPVS